MNCSRKNCKDEKRHVQDVDLWSVSVYKDGSSDLVSEAEVNTMTKHRVVGSDEGIE